MLLLLLPAWLRPLPVRCGCTRVGSRLTLTGLPRWVLGASVLERVFLLPVRPQALLVPEGAVSLLPPVAEGLF